MHTAGSIILAALATFALANSGQDTPQGSWQGEHGGPPSGPPHGWDGPPPSNKQHGGPPGGWQGGPPQGFKGSPPSGMNDGWFGSWGVDKGGKPAGVPGMPKIPGAQMPIPMNALPGQGGKPGPDHGHGHGHHIARDVEDDAEEEDDDDEFSHLNARATNDEQLSEDDGFDFGNPDDYDDEGNVIAKREAHHGHGHGHGPPSGQQWGGQHPSENNWQHGPPANKPQNGDWNDHMNGGFGSWGDGQPIFPRAVDDFENAEHYDNEGNVIGEEIDDDDVSDDDDYSHVAARAVDVDGDDDGADDEEDFYGSNEHDEGSHLAARDPK